MKHIILSNGSLVEVDEDWYLFGCFNWCAYTNKHQYAKRRVRGIDAILHIEIAKLMGLQGRIDHIDRNSLNCQRSNLRSATRSQNQMNTSMYSNNTSGYKGVSISSSGHAYGAEIYKDSVRTFLGYFPTAIEASIAYEKAARVLFGQFIGQISS